MNLLKKFIRPLKKRILWVHLCKRFPNLTQKEIRELAFQKEWSKQFRKIGVQLRCGEYWNVYRFLSDILIEMPSLSNAEL